MHDISKLNRLMALAQFHTKQAVPASSSVSSNPLDKLMALESIQKQLVVCIFSVVLHFYNVLYLMYYMAREPQRLMVFFILFNDQYSASFTCFLIEHVVC